MEARMADTRPGQTGMKDQRKKFQNTGADISRHQKEKPEARQRDPANKPKN
jgi:hypothetical protein